MEEIFFDKWSCKERENRSFLLDENEIRRWYQKDIDQITHSIGFRKMQRKSQLLSEKDPRSRSRMIHTIEVSRIATEISEQLHLSKELTEAICLSHDIGTSPYGFIGNSFLSEKTSSKFSHETVGSIILLMLSKKSVESHVDRVKIENLLTDINNDKAKRNSKAKRSLFPSLSFKGLDFPLYVSKKSTNDENDNPKNEYFMHTMSPEIIDGVLNHGANGKPQTLEGQVVQFADNIAYLSQDIEDLLTTKIIDETAFTKISQQSETLCYITKKGTEFRRSWDFIDKQLDSVSLRDVFSESRGKRIAVLVKRFVEYNLRQLRNEKVKFYGSDILNCDIPKLETDLGLSFIINFIWGYIEVNYDNPLIKTSNAIQKAKIEQLWNILQDSTLTSKNACYNQFMDNLNGNSLFNRYDENWKRAFFISNLSWQDVDLIIDSFHERNYTFDIDFD